MSAPSESGLGLRTRLALTSIALAIPLAAGVALWQAHARRSAAEDALLAAVRDRADEIDPSMCEAMPEHWPLRPRARDLRPAKRRLRGARRAPELWAYGLDFASRNPAAPPFDPELRRELEEALANDPDAAMPAATVIARREGRDVVRVAVRVPTVTDASPCAIVTAERRLGTGTAPVLRTMLPAVAIAAITILIAVLVAGPLFRRIREQLAALHARDAALRAYVADTTHDVLLPLTVLQGHLATMKKRVEAGGAIDAQTLEAALDESHYLASLMANLAAAAKLEGGEAHVVLHDVDLREIVERVIARHAPIAAQRGVALDFAVPDAPVRARADDVLAEQALSNLVHNAVRYADRGGHVAVVLEHEGSSFVLRVTDDGPGIPDAELARVLERRIRGDAARTRQPHGLGLGLSIAKAVADKHGWRLQLRNIEPRGLEAEIGGSARDAAPARGAGG